MNKYVEKSLKVTGAVCVATGVVAMSALVASGAAVGAVMEGFKAAGNTMKKMLAEETRENACEESMAEAQASDKEENTVEAQASATEEVNAAETLTEETAVVENNESV